MREIVVISPEAGIDKNISSSSITQQYWSMKILRSCVSNKKCLYGSITYPWTPFELEINESNGILEEPQMYVISLISLARMWWQIFLCAETFRFLKTTWKIYHSPSSGDTAAHILVEIKFSCKAHTHEKISRSSCEEGLFFLEDNKFIEKFGKSVSGIVGFIGEDNWRSMNAHLCCISSIRKSQTSLQSWTSCLSHSAFMQQFK